MTWISYEEQGGTPVQAGKVRLTPISRFLKITPPGWNGGVVWNRPVAVQVEHESGEVQVLPVQDVTRQALVSFAALGLMTACLFALTRRKKR